MKKQTQRKFSLVTVSPQQRDEHPGSWRYSEENQFELNGASWAGDPSSYNSSREYYVPDDSFEGSEYLSSRPVARDLPLDFYYGEPESIYDV